MAPPKTMPTSSPPLLHQFQRKQTRKPPWNSTFSLLSISMSTLLLFSLLSLALFFPLSSSSNRHYHKNPPFSPRNSPVSASNSSQIRLACQSTRFPQPCEASLTQSSSTFPPNPTSLQLIQSAISVSSNNLKTGQSMVKSILDSSKGNLNRTDAATICVEILSYSDYRLKSASAALTRGKIKDARAWMSAALCYQYDCWSALKYANDTKLVDQTMAFLNSLTQHSSNALSMMVAYDNYGDDMASWVPPKTERDGFYEKGSGGTELGFNGGFPSNLKADVTVCKDGSGGCYKTVQEAVNAAPDNAEAARRFVIHIKEGLYEETVRVPLEKKNVVFLGDGMGKTIITGALNVGQPGITTYDTATVGVVGDGFMASGLTIRNTAGPGAHQAVAFRSDSDLSVVENCEFIGNQDTLYVHSLRQFYKKCRIQGNVDFIFGNSASVFQDCEILVAPRQLKPEKGENNAVTAHGRTDPAQSTGLVFQKCLINGTDEYMRYYYSKPKVHKNFLGRPWKEYSRTVFINCELGPIISPNGWMPWKGELALKTLFYGEFGNSGPGSNVSKRVPWSTQIPPQRVYAYSVQNFIQGDQWIPTSS